MAPRQLRNACLTINNWTQAIYDSVCKYWEEECRYCIIGKEIGEQGTHHLQIYMQLSRRVSFNVFKRKFPTAHIESARGSPEDNKAYCSKEGDWLEIGTLQSPRSAAQETSEKFKTCIKLAREGNFDKIQDDYPEFWTRYHSCYLRTHSLARKRPDNVDELNNLWIHGDPGAGKSYYARSISPSHFVKSHNKWWDGYNGEDVVVLDDLDHDTAKWCGSFIKAWADHYPFNAEIKGGSICIRPKRIIVTSNYSIEELFSSDKMLCDAITRRFTIKKFDFIDRIFVPN